MRDHPVVWIYNLLWMLALPGVVCYLWMRRLVSGKYRHNLRSRFGLDLHLLREPGSEDVAWVHALSVGEVISVLPLIRLLREGYPSHQLFFSTTTESGHSLALERLAGSGCPLLYLPVDLWWVMRRVVARVGARLFVLVETDLWPNLLCHLRRHGTTTVLVNGRISDRSFPRYRLLRAFMRPALSNVSLFCMQGEEDARRLRALGVQPHKVRITGNLKLDQPVGLLPAEERESVLRRLDWVPQGPVWVAGSTHPGEEEILLRVFDRLRRRFPGFCLVVAPRNPRRAAEVATLAERAGWRSHRRCLAGAVPTRVDVFILDTIGELAGIYSLATFAFVGGSLVPAGGHNPIEPAQRGVPVVFGPHMSNFSDIAAILRANGAGFQVVNEAGLVDRLERWLEAPHLCCEDGERARRTVAAHQGAARRTMEAIREFL